MESVTTKESIALIQERDIAQLKWWQWSWKGRDEIHFEERIGFHEIKI